MFTFIKWGGYLVRQIYDFDCEEETSFWFIIKDKFGGFEELSSKMRNQVRKSLKTYSIRRVDSNEMLRVGYPIYTSAITQYRVKASLASEETWRNGIVKNRNNKNYEYWIAYHTGTRQAVAYAKNLLVQDTVQYHEMKCDPAFMHNSTYPYYGLIFEMTKYYLEDMGLKYVCDGSRSITEHSNIQGFLVDKLAFRKAYCKLDITYKPWFGLIVRMLYPFRNIMPIPQVKAILIQEAMARGDY